ncbi:hypothetical protein [Streptomyces canus]|uniref:hypothetical protein n=1 Tax=Streptomyces canus TaxID=58343 RepID=UPI00277ED298|nr:hypothetical protein [Streptomyces canus]MDQ1064619.1 regulator of protease activity HflC (stomatin/prohibitin superfamily) [Streptomyces canus]
MSTPPPAPPAPGAGPLISQRALLILLAAVVIGAAVGVLTFFSVGSAAGAILAGLGGSGASTMGLHLLTGP